MQSDISLCISFLTANEEDEVNPGDLSYQKQSTQRSVFGKVDALYGRIKEMSFSSLSHRPTTHETAGDNVSTSRAGMEIIMRIFPVQCEQL